MRANFGEHFKLTIFGESHGPAIGVVVDGYLIGVYAFSAAPSVAQWDKHIETPTVYLLSDFPVEPTDYKHLAKLVLYAALSKESKRIAERITKRRAASLVKKTEQVRVFDPAQNLGADAWKFDYRLYYDLFIRSSLSAAVYAYVY